MRSHAPLSLTLRFAVIALAVHGALDLARAVLAQEGHTAYVPVVQNPGSLEDRVAALEYKLQNVVASTDAVTVTGANLYVVNGTGYTDAYGPFGKTNGLGNVIIGYNEPSAPEDVISRSGSHMLVIGKGNKYTSWGGIVCGEDNGTWDRYASVIGGYRNTAIGEYSTVTGGDYNVAGGPLSAVSGGSSNTASRPHSTVSGGYRNRTSGAKAWVGGGSDNQANGDFATVSGGYGNVASGSHSAVAGGASNDASGEMSSVAGGFNNTAVGDQSSVSGGCSRTAPGDYNWVAGSLLEPN